MSARPIELLLIEDNPGDTRLFREAFKERTILANLTAVRDGLEAMRYLYREQPYEASPRPDLIVLDLNLPKTDGREVLTRIKRDGQLKRIPVVVLTSSCAEDDIRRAYDCHANCYITKPVDFCKFVSVIQSIETFWLSVVTLPST